MSFLRGLLVPFALVICVTESFAEEGDAIVKSEHGKLFRDLFSLILPASRSDEEMTETGRLVNGGIFNTSLAFTIPLFSFTLPDRVGQGKDYQTQWALAIIGATLVGGATLIPYIWNAPSIGKKKRSTDESEEQQESLVSRITSSLAMTRKLMSSDGEECLARFACECSSQPNKYGLFGIIVKYMFPVQNILERSASKKRSDVPLTCNDFGEDCSYLQEILRKLNYP